MIILCPFCRVPIAIGDAEHIKVCQKLPADWQYFNEVPHQKPEKKPESEPPF